MTELLDRVMEDCGARAVVPGYWSDWFAHTAMCLALLHEWRGGDSTMEEWLARVLAADGPSSMAQLAKHLREPV